MRSFCLSLVIFLVATPAFSGIGDYFKGYQPGIEISSTSTQSTLSYQAPAPMPPEAVIPNGCTRIPEKLDMMNCALTLQETSLASFGFFVQQAFKRKGWVHYDADVAFAFFSQDSSIDRGSVGFAEQPLTSASIHLYGLNSRGYVTLGLTPLIFPDILLSLGLGGQLAGGNIKVQGQRENVFQAVPLSYFELEVVWARFGRGALSSYFSGDANTQERKVYDHQINGMRAFTMKQSQGTLGLLKLVLPFPRGK